jgi:aldose sugar dehydrogenase
VWNGSSLTQADNLIRIRALQPLGSPGETGQFGNHDGGVIAFGPDGKLYIFVGDGGRRGQMQNLEFGPLGPGHPAPQLGGPQPDDAHLTGVVLRLNADGSAPADNPFFTRGAAVGGEVGANLQKVFSYGHRNSFGFDFDPVSGVLWLQENGDDSFSELNRVEPGMNSGWVQIMGPASRVADFRTIETTVAPDPPDPFAPNGYFGLQQIRWPPSNIADTPAQALARLFMLRTLL